MSNCDYCNGKGWVACVKKVTCTECGGSGERGDHPCRRCNGDGQVWCYECHGQGQVRCSFCRGTGKV